MNDDDARTDDTADTGASPVNPDAPDHEPTDDGMTGEAAQKIEDARKAQADALAHAEDDAPPAGQNPDPIVDADS